MTRRITRSKNRQARTTLAAKYVGDTRGMMRRKYKGAGKFKDWLRKAGRSVWKGTKAVAKFAKKNKLLSKGALIASQSYPELAPAVPILKALGLGHCKGKKCSMKKPCRMCYKKMVMVSNMQGKGLKLAGAGVSTYRAKGKSKHRKRKCKGKGLSP
jgi:hypothetical protein